MLALISGKPGFISFYDLIDVMNGFGIGESGNPSDLPALS